MKSRHYDSVNLDLVEKHPLPDPWLLPHGGSALIAFDAPCGGKAGSLQSDLASSSLLAEQHLPKPPPFFQPVLWAMARRPRMAYLPRFTSFP
jgi:hypothetical protein